MNEVQIVETLRNAGLKRTPVRVAVMRKLHESKFALSQPDLESLFDSRENRVTVYRVLRDLEEHGLIHRVYDNEGTAKFALCHACDEHEHHDEHLHFNCTICKNVYCLDEFSVPFPALPNGFQVNSYRFTVEGVCKNCN